MVTGEAAMGQTFWPPADQGTQELDFLRFCNPRLRSPSKHRNFCPPRHIWDCTLRMSESLLGASSLRRRKICHLQIPTRARVT